MKCGKCGKIIKEKDAVKIKRTDGSKSTIARYPIMYVCAGCVDDSELYTPPDSNNPLNIKINKICNKCGLEFTLIIGSKVNGFYGITQQKCPYCRNTNDLWIIIEKVEAN